MRIKSRTSFYKNPLVILVCILLVAGGIAFAYFYAKDKTSSTPNQGFDSTRPANSVDYSGPSEEDISHSQDAKRRGDNNQETDKSENPDIDDTGKRTVDIGISYAKMNTSNQLEVRAFVNEVIEGSGICTLALTKGSETITVSTPGFVDVSSTICEPLYIDRSKLSPGTWQAVVNYSSPDASGTSNQVVVNVE